MKTLADRMEVSSRSYYFLLDWNEQNEWRYIAENFGKEKLKDLTLPEYKQLFKFATESELNQF
jgi:hypothetical protein